MMRPGYLPLRSSKKNSSSLRGGDDRKTDSTCMYNNLEQPANINISPWYPQIMLMSIMYSAANANLQYCAQLGDMNSSKERYCDTAQSISACRGCSMMQLAGRHLPMGPCRQYTTAATASHHVKLAKARQARRRCKRTAARLKRMYYYTFRSKDTAILEYPRTVVELHLRLTYDEDEPLRVDLIAGEFHNCHGYANVQIMPSTDPSRHVSLLIDASPYRIYKVCSALNCKMPHDMRCNNLPNNKSLRHPRVHPQQPATANLECNTYKKLLQMAQHQTNAVASWQETHCYPTPKTVWVYCPTHLLLVPRIEDRLMPSWVNGSFVIVQDPLDEHLYAAIPAGQTLLPPGQADLRPEQWAWLPADLFLEHYGISATASAQERRAYVRRLPKAARKTLRPVAEGEVHTSFLGCHARTRSRQPIKPHMDSADIRGKQQNPDTEGAVPCSQCKSVTRTHFREGKQVLPVAAEPGFL